MHGQGANDNNQLVTFFNAFHEFSCYSQLE